MKEPQGLALRIEELLRPAIEAMGLRLWDLRYEQEAGEWYLRVLIEREGPMDTDTCEAASRAIEPILDEADPIAQSYILEVGSPGLGRRLCRGAHFRQMIGQKIMAKLYAPNSQNKREVAGILLAYDGDMVEIKTESGPVCVPIKSAAVFKSCDDEDLF